MKKLLKPVYAIALVSLAPQLAVAQWSDGHEGHLVIRGGWLFDSISDERRPNTGIVIQDGKIVEVDAELEQQVLSTANVIDLAETDTILPGMIDLHAHYNLDLVDNGRVEEVVYNGVVFLANGVTSTWSAGEMSILIDQAQKHGMTTAAHLANYDWEYDVELRDAILMGLDRVEHQITLGSGGPDSAEMPEMIDLMIAHDVFYDANLQMYGGINERRTHASEMVWTDEAQYFTPYAQDLLEKRGEPKPESDAEEFSQRVLELKSLFDAGGEHLLIVGTDEPVYTNLLPGFAYHRELLAMTYAGIPPATVLKAATINGARALGVDSRLGSIEPGKLADLYVVRGNPLDDIKVARDISLVIKDGVDYDPADLLKSAEGKIGPTGPDDHADWELELRPLRRA